MILMGIANSIAVIPGVGNNRGAFYDYRECECGSLYFYSAKFTIRGYYISRCGYPYRTQKARAAAVVLADIALKYKKK